MNLDRIKRKLKADPDSLFFWTDGGYLPTGGYDVNEVSGLCIRLMLNGIDVLYTIFILPADEPGEYDVYVRSSDTDRDLIHMLTRRARDQEEVVLAALENLPDYL